MLDAILTWDCRELIIASEGGTMLTETLRYHRHNTPQLRRLAIFVKPLKKVEPMLKVIGLPKVGKLAKARCKM